MNRVELYQQKPKPTPRKGLLLFLMTCMILAAGLTILGYYYQNSIKIDAPSEELGEKVVIDLPNGHKVYTYENLIVEKDGKMYYKGDLNTMDLTGGTISYENWKDTK
ncbi:hypothetical protein [Neobacillus mesonae]|uniref:hypothetical protein n=1 Tax=Neobacillus mesonae TaxID=1193713 RepID=UPI00203E8B9F|nr:hypothetical protein [Neobacillus mesonae]MCM3566908.1 hypothetical protein [Neobacillus mesonae]